MCRQHLRLESADSLSFRHPSFVGGGTTSQKRIDLRLHLPSYQARFLAAARGYVWSLLPLSTIIQNESGRHHCSQRIAIIPLSWWKVEFRGWPMAHSVYRAGHFVTFLKLKKVQKRVLSGRYRWRYAESVEEVERDLAAPPTEHCFVDGPFGVGNMVPFSRVPDKLRQPQKLHYQIPACGAHGRLQVVANVNFVPEAAL